ncbi:hypothetical protein EBT25_18875, partial [bacterium]|nr:hypothetical protein [bacterium]
MSAQDGLKKEQALVDSFVGITPDIVRIAHVTKERLSGVEEVLKEQPRAAADCTLQDAKKRLSVAENHIMVHARKKPEDEPQISEAYIAEKEAEHSVWLNTIRYMEINLEDIEGRIKTLVTVQERLYTELKELQGGQKDAPRSRNGHIAGLKELKDWEEFAASVTDMTMEELDQRIYEVKEYLASIKKVRTEVETLVHQAETLATEKKSYSDVEFNIHCTACQKNPLKKRLDEVVKELKSVEAKSKKLKKRLADMEKTEKEYKAELDDIIAARPDR